VSLYHLQNRNALIMNHFANHAIEDEQDALVAEVMPAGDRPHEQSREVHLPGAAYRAAGHMHDLYPSAE
jgi:hypothetical protein